MPPRPARTPATPQRLRVVTGRTRRPIDFGPETLLFSGGEATVHDASALAGPAQVAKIYKHPTAERSAKLQVMLAAPPEDPHRGERHHSLTWPVDVLHDESGAIVGYLMRRVHNAAPLIDYINPLARLRAHPHCNYLYLQRMARNLALTVAAVHDCQYAIGDINESNVLGHDTALITLVDTDSFQIVDRERGRSFRCLVGKPEFTPPELQGVPFADVDRTPEHDRFGMAVLIFQLLMEGTHPFAGLWQGPGEPPSIAERIKAGISAWTDSGRGQLAVAPYAPPIGLLTTEMQTLFAAAFAHDNPHHRPSARTWVSALASAEQALQTCPANRQHRFGDHLDRCPWCERRELLQGIDPFPETPAPVPAALVAPLPAPRVVTAQVVPAAPRPVPVAAPVARPVSPRPGVQSTSATQPAPPPAFPQFRATRHGTLLGAFFIALVVGVIVGSDSPHADAFVRVFGLCLGVVCLKLLLGEPRLPEFATLMMGIALFRPQVPARFTAPVDAAPVLIGAGVAVVSMLLLLRYRDVARVNGAKAELAICVVGCGVDFPDGTIGTNEVAAVIVNPVRPPGGATGEHFRIDLVMVHALTLRAESTYDVLTDANQMANRLAKELRVPVFPGAPGRVFVRTPWGSIAPVTRGSPAHWSGVVGEVVTKIPALFVLALIAVPFTVVFFDKLAVTMASLLMLHMQR